MKTEFVKAVLPDDLNRLVAFEHKVFPKADWFPKREWEAYESYWMVVDGGVAGCCAFEHNVDFDHSSDENPPLDGSLYIASTGIGRRFQGQGFGRLLKAWEIAYARHHGFTRIVTNHRASNEAIIRLNKAFGFRVLCRPKAIYYRDPEEPTVVMELRFDVSGLRHR